MLQIDEGPLPGCRKIRLSKYTDDRGGFVKTFSYSSYAVAGLAFDFREEFYSTSRKGCIRGMHFQFPPHAHEKIVYCAYGAVEDVLLDLRRGGGYGAVASVTLSEAEPLLLYIPKGIAHGFLSLQDDSLMVYKTSTEYAPQCDSGIRWDSFGYAWNAEAPIMSERDRKHVAFVDFVSPF
jgi:dTDP-4-dehydrorhamnose 3,5-epimerase